MSEIKTRITQEMKAAMKAGDKARLGTIRMIMAAFKQHEVDTRAELDDTQALSILDKMTKQRRESIKQYQDAGRDELAAQEQNELEIIREFLPQPLSDEEINSLIAEAVQASGASSVRDMGAVMNILRPKVQGRADMSAVSQKVKAALSD